MFYSPYPPSPELDDAIAWAEDAGIQVQSIGAVIFITVQRELWTNIAEGNLAMIDLVLFSMLKLYEASNTPVRVLLPGNFCVTMNAWMRKDYIKQASTFSEYARLALMTNLHSNQKFWDANDLI